MNAEVSIKISLKLIKNFIEICLHTVDYLRVK